jgi:hypothetical protein
MPPRKQPGAEAAEDAPEVLSPPPEPPDLQLIRARLDMAHRATGAHSLVLREQERFNLSAVIALTALLVLLLIQDKEIQALTRAVRALQEAV